MARKSRRKSDEINFGSDSFLDIVANVVGIVIILIVLVGVKVRNTPAKSTLDESRAELIAKRLADWETQRDQILRENENAERLYQQQVTEQEEEMARRRTLLEERRRTKRENEEALAKRNKEIEARLAILHQYEDEARRLSEEILGLTLQIEKDTNVRQQVTTENQRLEAQATATKAEIDDVKRELQARQASLVHEKGDWQTVSQQVAELKNRLAEMEKKKYVRKTWVHYATPLARRVHREEVHFRCLNGRIADTHLEALIDRIKQDLYRGRSTGRLYSTSVVGPIAGFSLRYSLSRSGVSLSEQVSNPFAYSIQVSGWELIGESDTLGEEQSVALKPGSDFQASLAVHPSSTHAITLWVYPDSFELAKAVQVQLHERGYVVALRPLPHGIPVAGSPFGSASRGQ